MNHRIWFVSSIGCAALLAVALFAQDAPPSSESIDITGIPEARGVYYHASSGWATLSPSVLMPLWDGRAAALEILNVGSDHTVTQLPGRHAGIQIGNDARPIFYLHGISPADLYLVRATTKAGYREIRMPISRDFWEWAHFRDKDVTDFDIQGMNGDIIAIRPSADLKPGEYTLASVVQPGYQWVRLGFEFGILGTSAR